MTPQNKEMLIPANGMLQGLAYVVGPDVADALCTVSEMIVKVIEAEGKNETN